MKIKPYFLECFGTFLMVFVGTGSIVSCNLIPFKFPNIVIALSFGLIIALTIVLIGKQTGAHINPAVSIGFFFNKSLNFLDLIFYVFFQFLGAIFASALLKVFFPNITFLGHTIPHISFLSSFICEFLFTFLLMLVILLVVYIFDFSDSLSGLLIGSVVSVAALVIGPFTGASLNPARSFGPMLITNVYSGLWIYFIAPCLGSIVAVLLFRNLR